MLYCASYKEPLNHHGQLVSISRSVPRGVEVAEHLDCFKPSKELLTWWQSTAKDSRAWAEYTSRFWALLAERKTQILDWIAALGRKPTNDMTLLCWERAGQLCHRNLVARLLQKHCISWFGGCDVPQFKVGDRVAWEYAPTHLTFLEPFEIRQIEGDRVWFLWMETPVKLAEVRKID